MEFNIRKLHYDIDQVLGHFNMTRSQNCPLIDTWLSEESTYPNLPELLEEKRLDLVGEGDVWNEEELKMHFISILFAYARIQIPHKIKLFYERTISATVKNTPLTVICDALVATPLGINTPKAPYFFLQEFKKGKKSQDDAEGQMLTAMLIAQELNKDAKPLYGCYVQGWSWVFSTLHDTHYCVSRPYSARNVHDLQQILTALQRIPKIVL
jgi:hypothetical protein